MGAAAESGWATIHATQFVDMCRNIDREFSLHNAHEPDNLSRKEGVVRALNELLMNKLGVGLIARKFARLRTFIRMKAINSTRQLEAMEKRAGRRRKHHSQ